MTPGTLNIEFVAGDGYSLAITCQDSNGAALSQSAYTWTAKVRKNWYTATADATAFTVDATAAATGVITLSLTAVQTRALGFGKQVWDTQRALGAADPVTVLRGTVTVLPDATR